MTGPIMTLHRAIAEIPAREWDGCAGDDNPFVSHAFLSALEDSGSASPDAGWMPQHLAMRDAAGRLLAVAPFYAKSHSFGEYVFDQQWAQAFARAGGEYYPKLQVAVPFSPVPGPRLLVHADAPDADALRQMAARALRQACGELGLSSVHVTFCTGHEYDLLGRNGWLQRLGVQYHWDNEGYATFDDFLDTLASRKRKAIRRERRDAQACGLSFQTYRGAEITPALWRRFYEFYLSTVDRKWGRAYLQPTFFRLLSERLGDRVVLMVAMQGDTPVAGALNLMGRDALYGRNWGRLEGDWPFLHFELCYYQAIDFAIAHGLKRVEAGAQGEHKLQRGYRPCLTHSAHWIAHPGLRAAVGDFLERERAAIEAELPALDALTPYRTAL
ncbi:GNAT family N-acetyltransferase [Komagataeibacter sp. FNDCR2]|uniref:GNAT family N-acetyltransferase n=1 Tax=Komagataeibacter sp. FNDCR2 TaxID=2878682 RepID=UPI001E456CCD|nr:GNAT family N-acetyltransferase [Komagataeibacter sp. FNDCR2]MCE2576071.1 GNAT family N-acetyltransferase [Komagataeibacter sp. FNDCR2]